MLFCFKWIFAYKYILSISTWLFIKFNYAFVFHDPKPCEPPKLPKYFVWMIWKVWLLWIMFSFDFISIIIKVNHFIFTYSNNSVLHTFGTLVPYKYVVILPRFYNLLSSLLFGRICCENGEINSSFYYALFWSFSVFIISSSIKWEYVLGLSATNSVIIVSTNLSFINPITF